jgi:hypothetical protein
MVEPNVNPRDPTMRGGSRTPLKRRVRVTPHIPRRNTARKEKTTMARRVTIHLRVAAQGSDPFFEPVFEEWVPYGGETFDDHGVTFDWDDGTESFFPYSNIVRIDYGPDPT